RESFPYETSQLAGENMKPIRSILDPVAPPLSPTTSERHFWLYQRPHVPTTLQMWEPSGRNASVVELETQSFVAVATFPPSTFSEATTGRATLRPVTFSIDSGEQIETVASVAYDDDSEPDW